MVPPWFVYEACSIPASCLFCIFVECESGYQDKGTGRGGWSGLRGRILNSWADRLGCLGGGWEGWLPMVYTELHFSADESVFEGEFVTWLLERWDCFFVGDVWNGWKHICFCVALSVLSENSRRGLWCFGAFRVACSGNVWTWRGSLLTWFFLSSGHEGGGCEAVGLYDGFAVLSKFDE